MGSYQSGWEGDVARAGRRVANWGPSGAPCTVWPWRMNRNTDDFNYDKWYFNRSSYDQSNHLWPKHWHFYITVLDGQINCLIKKLDQHTHSYYLSSTAIFPKISNKNYTLFASSCRSYCISKPGIFMRSFGNIADKLSNYLARNDCEAKYYYHPCVCVCVTMIKRTIFAVSL